MSPKSEQTKRGKLISFFADILEIYCFPALLIYVIIQNILLLIFHHWPNLAGSYVAFDMGIGGTTEIITIIHFAKTLMIILFNVTVVLALVTRKNLLQGATKIREVLLPLAIIYFWALLNLSAWLPKYFNISIIPLHLTFVFTLIGVTLDIIGWLICLTAIFNLRHSFSIFVKAYPMTTVGMYKIVRHPIYSGHILVAIGLAMAMPSILTITMTVIYIALTYTRARIEEEKLLKFFPKYQNYIKTTPMFIPRFK